MKKRTLFLATLIVMCMAAMTEGYARPMSGEDQYRQLSKSAADARSDLFSQINSEARDLSWEGAATVSFEGNLRLLKKKGGGEGLYFLRKLDGEILILAVPREKDPRYEGLEKMTESRMQFKVNTVAGTVDGTEYAFARFTEAPRGLLFERIFKISSVLMLFLIMVGMGLTLTVNDFAVVFRKPRGIIVGLAIQYGIMPLVALGLCHALGFYGAYPFIFIGMILATSVPAGVTSNLLTQFAKGDLALSISMTSISTILSLVCTPLLLTLYASGVSEVSVPGALIAQTIVVLVIVPLAIGMSFRAKWKNAAAKAAPVFSALGILTVIFLIVAGVLSNLHVFRDTARYNVVFYLGIFALIASGMLVGWVLARLVRVNPVQSKSIALGTGVRNSVLSMTLALLLQDGIGDFYSSMFIVAGIYGLEMYIAGTIAIVLFRKFVPQGVQEGAQ